MGFGSLKEFDWRECERQRGDGGGVVNEEWKTCSFFEVWLLDWLYCRFWSLRIVKRHLPPFPMPISAQWPRHPRPRCNPRLPWPPSWPHHQPPHPPAIDPTTRRLWRSPTNRPPRAPRPFWPLCHPPWSCPGPLFPPSSHQSRCPASTRWRGTRTLAYGPRLWGTHPRPVWRCGNPSTRPRWLTVYWPSRIRSTMELGRGDCRCRRSAGKCSRAEGRWRPEWSGCKRPCQWRRSATARLSRRRLVQGSRW